MGGVDSLQKVISSSKNQKKHAVHKETTVRPTMQPIFGSGHSIENAWLLKGVFMCQKH